MLEKAMESHSPNHNPPPVDTGMVKRQEGKEEEQKALPALLPSVPLGQGKEAAAGDAEVQTITVDGMGIKIDKLGPIIVNTDGTLTRISNWGDMSEGERQTALRRIARRNKERTEQLRRLEEQDGSGEQGQG